MDSQIKRLWVPRRPGIWRKFRHCFPREKPREDRSISVPRCVYSRITVRSSPTRVNWVGAFATRTGHDRCPSGEARVASPNARPPFGSATTTRLRLPLANPPSRGRESSPASPWRIDKDSPPSFSVPRKVALRGVTRQKSTLQRGSELHAWRRGTRVTRPRRAPRGSPAPRRSGVRFWTAWSPTRRTRGRVNPRRGPSVRRSRRRRSGDPHPVEPVSVEPVEMFFRPQVTTRRSRRRSNCCARANATRARRARPAARAALFARASRRRLTVSRRCARARSATGTTPRRRASGRAASARMRRRSGGVSTRRIVASETYATSARSRPVRRPRRAHAPANPFRSAAWITAPSSSPRSSARGAWRRNPRRLRRSRIRIGNRTSPRRARETRSGNFDGARRARTSSGCWTTPTDRSSPRAKRQRSTRGDASSLRDLERAVAMM